MKELSIFIDESGDFGEYDYHSPYYIITMVFHDQNEDIQPAISKLNQELSYLNLENNMFSKSETSFFGNIRDLKKII